MTPDTYIERAVYLGNFIILFETTDGEMRTIDFKPLLSGNMGAFNSLRNEDVFKKFYLDTNILTWDIELTKKNEDQINQFDIAPEYITIHSKPIMISSGEYRIPVSYT